MELMKFGMYQKIRIFLIKWHLGSKKDLFVNEDLVFFFAYSDDEGSEDEEDDDEDEEEEEEEDDDDYHEVEEENEISSNVSLNNSKQQSNGFQFGATPKPEIVSGLSNMMSKFDFNVNSSFNFNSPSTTEVILLIFSKTLF